MKLLPVTVLLVFMAMLSNGKSQGYDGEDAVNRSMREDRERRTLESENRRRDQAISTAQAVAARAEAAAKKAINELDKQKAAEQARLDEEQRRVSEAARVAAEEVEKRRLADLARDEGARHLMRLKRYEAERKSGMRADPARPKATSFMELKMPDGRIAIVVSGEQHVFQNKTEADEFIAQVRKADSTKADARAAYVRQIEKETATSYDRVVARYPWLADTNGVFSKQLDAYVNRLQRDPANAPLFAKTDWPETVTLQWGVQCGYLRPDGSVIESTK